ncbi:hypothetical protein TNCV_3072291 [Trichonephila clavipes]|nr:hypothetical protein TNCV_3072291 [Trichonephila clavipes]
MRYGYIYVTVVKEDQFSIAQLMGMTVRNGFDSVQTIEEKIPTLYGKDIDKVELYMDKAISPISKPTAPYLAKKESETGKKCIPFDEIHVKSPNASAIRLLCFRFFKTILRKMASKNTEGTLENSSKGME